MRAVVHANCRICRLSEFGSIFRLQPSMVASAFLFVLSAQAVFSQDSAPSPDPSPAPMQAPPVYKQPAAQSTAYPYSNQQLEQYPANQSSAPPVDQNKPLLLQGSAIVHAEAMAPVAPQLQAGVEFDEQALPKLQPNNDWYPIPAWYAGYKHIENQTILQDYNFQTGQSISPNRTVLNRQDLPIGFQVDRNGQIWEFKRAPYSTTMDGGKTLSTTIVRSRDPIQVTQSNVVVRLVETSIVVDKRSRRILRSMQEEQINYFTPAGNGAMNLQSSVKSFAANGAPMVQETSVRTVTQIAPFQPIDSYQGMDMRSMFRDFMIAKGYGNALPDNLQPAPAANTVVAPNSAAPSQVNTDALINDSGALPAAPSTNPASPSTADDTTINAPGAPPVAPSLRQ